MHTPDGYGNSKLNGAMLGTSAGRAEHDQELEHGHQAQRPLRRRPDSLAWRSSPSTGPEPPGVPQHASGGPRRRRGARRAAQRPHPSARWSRTSWRCGPHCPDGLVVGLDFSFSFPAWFVRHVLLHRR